AACVWLASISTSAMHSQESHWRFLALASAALSMAIGLVVAGNIVLLAVFWTFLALAGVLMMDTSARFDGDLRSSRTCLVVLAAGSACLIAGLAVFWVNVRAVDIRMIAFKLSSGPEAASTALHGLALRPRFIVEVLLSLWVMSALALFPLRIWFLSTSRGSALARVVCTVLIGASSVFVFARFGFLFSQKMLAVFGVLGLATAALSALGAMISGTISRAVAQLILAHFGLAVAAVGFGAPRHGLTHAWVSCVFGTLLLLWSAGIEARAGTGELARLGGLKHKMPLTLWTGLCGVFAAAAFPPFSAYWSGGGVVDRLFEFGLGQRLRSLLPGLEFVEYVIPVVAVFVVAGVSFAIFRLCICVFLGEPRDKQTLKQARELPIESILPAALLSLAAIAGAEFLPVKYAWLKTDLPDRVRSDRLRAEPDAVSVSVPRTFDQMESDQIAADELEADEAEIVEFVGLRRVTLSMLLVACASAWGLLLAALAYWPSWTLRKRLRILDPDWTSKRFGFLRRILGG
ncbi:MAG: proton-conducting transporter membrane subunit, partial [Planctomycetota bacterium]|nr:proton-conducting transporter membrane subunit [Planctomycetota bacterium]